MSADRENIEHMLEQLERLLAHCQAMERRYADRLARVHPDLQASARNLLHYRAMRQHDIRGLQNSLGHLGLSRLGRAEGHVMASIVMARELLGAFLEPRQLRVPATALSIEQGDRLLEIHAEQLLGYRSRGRRVRIMVTQPSAAAYNRRLVTRMVEKGMNTARINCAHDGPEAWARMIENLTAACRGLDRKCGISMDLGGPKIRTGSIEAGPRVLKLRPRRDRLGRTVEPARALLWPEGRVAPADTLNRIPLPRDFIDALRPGDRIAFRDARGSRRTLSVNGKDAGCWQVHCRDTAYLLPGLRLAVERGPREETLTAKVGQLPALEQFLLLRIGDRLRVHREPCTGRPAVVDADGAVNAPARIGCTSEEVFRHLRVGEPVVFDDGRIRGEIVERRDDRFEVEVVYAAEGGARLRADKGINFPQSDLQFSGLTAKDRQDLRFIARHADMVNVSFVNRVADVQELLSELRALQAEDSLGIILKIETQSGFNNLTDILIEAMQAPRVGVMIARGDLAVECGWENMARIQEEILSLCQSAHVPVVWATQVLENLAKKGIPSRAEITDAAMAQRAECVMLNKGPHISLAVRMLDYILRNMEDYRHKRAPMLPMLQTGGNPLDAEEVVKHV